MGADYKRENETFQQDYDKLFAKGSWSTDEINMLKDLKKLIYYNTLLCEMEEAKEDNGGNWERHSGGSGARRSQSRNSMGQYTSGESMGYNGGNGNNGGSGTYYPPYYFDNRDDWASGRRYYDSEKDKAIHKLHHMMDNTDDPERKNALRIAINELEMK